MLNVEIRILFLHNIHIVAHSHIGFAEGATSHSSSLPLLPGLVSSRRRRLLVHVLHDLGAQVLHEGCELLRAKHANQLRVERGSVLRRAVLEYFRQLQRLQKNEHESQIVEKGRRGTTKF
jgi:hypothetical protein